MSTLPLFDRDPAFAAIAPPKLRGYQARAIQTLRDRVREGKKRILLTLPTGGGKMFIIANVNRTSTLPSLFIAHRMELIDQCVRELARVGITNVGVIRGSDDRVNPSAMTQVASIQTLMRRDKPHAGILFIDEAHRAVGNQYLELLECYKDSIILGFTATPTRYDGRPLGNLFECLEIVCTYEKLIQDGFIASPLCYSAPEEPDLSSVPVASDYDEGILGEIMSRESLIGNLLDHWLRLSHMHEKNGRLVEGPRRRTFIFAVNIRHSLDICERFSKHCRIAHLDGTTPETERRRILKAIEAGELDAVSNVGVLLEGVDIPSVKCIAHARPTQSVVLWRQSCGRALRPWEGIQPLILDHACNIGRLGFPHEDLHWELTQKARPIERKQAVRICQGCYAYLLAYKRLCPYCGFEAPSMVDPSDLKLPGETDGMLRQLPSTPQAMRQMYFNTMVRMARAKGYKPGFAGARYKEKYGHWPPWAWSEQAKATFASDPEWQANHEAHLKLKAKLEAIKKAKAKSGK